MSKALRLYHTTGGMILGEEVTRQMKHMVMGSMVRRPVVVVTNSDTVTLIPMYTLTESELYFIPDHTLLYGEPMKPAENLAATYAQKYLAPPPEGGIELSTSPAPQP